MWDTCFHPLSTIFFADVMARVAGSEGQGRCAENTDHAARGTFALPRDPPIYRPLRVAGPARPFVVCFRAYSLIRIAAILRKVASNRASFQILAGGTSSARVPGRSSR